MINRRNFMKGSLAAGAVLATGTLGKSGRIFAADLPSPKIQLGLVTYQWGKDWDIDTIIKNLSAAKVNGVELRTTHKHGVEPGISSEQRKEVKKRFADSPVKLVSLGSAECFDHVDPAKLAKAIETTKVFLRLSADVGSSGVKVRPNDFHKEVEREKTMEQIGKSLNIVGKFAGELGQQVRLEVHGSCSELPVIKKIMDIATDPNVGVCWNSNKKDVYGDGLEANFNLIKARLGATTHIRPLDTPGYPWDKLVELFVKSDYKGWLMLECSNAITDPIVALNYQRELFDKFIAKAQGK
ncbi:MAG: TIM barrel protein [Kiritimatiellae bacterium]|nr:TIM barrel protein [Kiritimatiellia bacterium]MDD5521545.1 TIM barrel protein [Kiritimatiellia bacterium]